MIGRFEILLVLIANLLVRMHGLRKRVLAAYLGPFCRRIQASSQERLRRQRSALSRLTVPSVLAPVRHACIDSSTEPRGDHQASITGRIATVCVSAYEASSHVTGRWMLQIETSGLYTQYRATSWVLETLNRQEERDQLRLNALNLILADRHSRIFFAQLMFWFLTRTRELDWVLGELVEGFERKVSKYNEEAGVSWAYRQLWMRIVDLLRAIGFLLTVVEFVARWLKRTRL